MVCPKCFKQFDRLAEIQGHRSGKRGGTYNPCQYTSTELEENRAAALAHKKKNNRERMRLKRGSIPKDVYLAELAEKRLSPEERKQRHNEASKRWKKAHPDKVKEIARNGKPLSRAAQIRKNIARKQRLAASEAARQRASESAKRWREAHPDKIKESNAHFYRTRIRSKRLKKAARIRENIARNLRRAASRIPDVPLTHPLLTQAAELVPNNSTLTVLYDPLNEDLRQEAILALLENRDPSEAVKAYRASEKAWHRITAEYESYFEGQ